MIAVSFSALFGSTASASPAAPSPQSSTNSPSNLLPYVSSTIDIGTHQTHSGNFAGNNFLAPTGMAYDSHNGNIYVGALEYGSVQGDRQYQNYNGSLLVVNASTMTVIGHINVGETPAYVAFDSFNNLVYVSNLYNDTISVVNALNNSLYGTIKTSNLPGAGSPLSIAVNSNNGTVYVEFFKSIAVISGKTVVTTFDPFPSYPSSFNLAYDPVNHYLYTALVEATFPGAANVTYENTGIVGVIDTLNDTVVAQINVGNLVDWLSYGNGNIYATGLVSKNITVIHSLSIVRNISIPTNSLTNFYDPVNGNIYVSAVSSAETSTAIYKIAEALGVVNGTSILNFYFNASLSLTAVTQGSLYVVNASTGNAVKTISEPIVDEFMTFAPSGTAYIDNMISGSIQRISTSFATSSLQISNTPTAVLYDQSNGYIYVADTIAGQVQVYSATTGVYVSTVDTGGFPVDMALDTTNNNVYVTNAFNQSLDVISGTSLVNYISMGSATVNISPATSLLEMMSGALPLGIVYNSQSNDLFVTAYSFSDNPLGFVSSFIKVIDAGTGSVSKVITFPAYAIDEPPELFSMVYNPVNKMVYLGGAQYNGSNSQYQMVVYVLNSSGIVNTLSTDIALNVEESPILQGAFDSSNGEVILPFYYGYVAVSSTNSVSYVSESFPTTPGEDIYPMSAAVAFDSYSNQVIISNFFTVHVVPSGNLTSDIYDTGEVVVFNATTMGQLGTVTVGQGSDGIATTSSGDIYVANAVYGTMSVLSPFSTSTGKLALHLLTPGATVTVNGQPLQLINSTYTAVLNPGYYYVNATLSGYYSFTDYFNVTPSSNTTLNISLKQMSNFGYLEGYTTPQSIVLQANNITVPVVNGYFNESLPAGSYFISASSPGYTPEVFRENVTRNKATNMNISLTASITSVSIVGHISPFNASLSHSVLVNGTSALVNSTGYFMVNVPAGTYTVSVYEQGYFPTSVTVQASGTTNVYFDLTPEPVANSTTSNGTATATGYNTSVANITVQDGALTVNFNASSNGTLILQVPYTTLKNVTLSELLNSKIYIGGKQYTNFTVTLTSNYTVFITVKGLSGDPTLYWVYSTSYKVPAAPPSGLPGFLMYALLGIVAVLVVIGAVFVASRSRKR